ncbi:tRNA pseudouridine synthase B [Chlamydiales bacterium STE3]|nr:tRNA pseudouridine synthase B [Chlamydiales bacterium STE3]
MTPCEGILLVNKPKGKTSFSLISALRRILKIKTIGHAGTLDPLATGVMILMVGKNYTRLSSQLLVQNKEYLAEITLGKTTDSYDAEGVELSVSNLCPTLDDLKKALERFQGEFLQVPPMFSAKKVNGQKLCDLARRGKIVEREPVKICAETLLVEYSYPKVILEIKCSKGTYIRSIAHDLGAMLGCGAFLSRLERTKSGSYFLEDCIDGNLLFDHDATDLARAQVYAALKKCQYTIP